ncbi:class I SAM-dependent methyltransferase [Bordetella flabilis]|uniref:Methyltransferase domain-containing protein n=1 Tax=Bordetella flabilis TaxID=463014 RepID=A0A193GKX1_9BORD|nr:class I SAM-dependent methyltransferase [Bordetella flabilis]ANN79909.1 hypothetical protein BAU07_24825 [Bordetella flabilis]
MGSINTVRKTLNEMGNHSHTTQKFQDDLLDYISAYATQGDCLIEVGCFRGGLTAQFAWLGKQLGQHVHVIDIDPGYMQIAGEAIEATSDTSNVSFHLCDFTTFVNGEGRDIRPSFALIDGDHYYDGVVADIKALLSMKTRPAGVAFHDFSLRYADPDLSKIRVDLALTDTLGKDFPHRKLGEISREGGPLRTKPQDDNSHYHEVGYSEGVLVEFRKL